MHQKLIEIIEAKKIEVARLSGMGSLPLMEISLPCATSGLRFQSQEK